MAASTSAPMAMAMPPSDMMLAVMPIMRKGMKESRTATGMVIIGMMALGICQRKSRITSATVKITSSERRLQVVDGAQDQIGAVVDGDDLDAGRQPRLDLPDLRLHPIDHIEGILAVAHDDDAGDHFALAVQVGRAAAQIGTDHHRPDVLDADGRTGLAGQTTIFSKSLTERCVAPCPAPCTRCRRTR